MQNLRCNRIGAEGETAIADALKVNSSVIKIDLSESFLGAGGELAFVEALKVNTSVTQIDFDEDRDCKGHVKVVELLARNRRLRHLFLFDARQMLLSVLCAEESGVVWPYVLNDDHIDKEMEDGIESYAPGTRLDCMDDAQYDTYGIVPYGDIDMLRYIEGLRVEFAGVVEERRLRAAAVASTGDTTDDDDDDGAAVPLTIDTAPTITTCSACRKPGSTNPAAGSHTTPLFYCGMCLRVAYCSELCQRRTMFVHNLNCKQPPQKRKRVPDKKL
jgi:hypothetical protein